MTDTLILASGSDVRAEMLCQARVPFEVVLSRTDEDSIKDSLKNEGAKPLDIADALAEAKARKVASKNPGRLVLGSDQVLQFENETLSKPVSQDDAVHQLQRLSGQSHRLLSAAVLYENNRPVWRHVSKATLYMRDFGNEWLTEYVDRNWESIQYSVGGYKIEEEGVRLFTKIEGDHFTILGLPLLELLSYLTLRGNLLK